MNEAGLRIVPKYTTMFTKLREIILESQKRVLTSEDALFGDNVNLFVKSYLVLAVCYLEVCLQDIVTDYSQELNQRLALSKIPYNFLKWRIEGKKKSNEDFGDANFLINSKEFQEGFSAKPDKSIEWFRYLGVNLEANESFRRRKDIVGAVVQKRNDIVHRNDDASEISFGDVSTYIEVFIEYLHGIEYAVQQRIL
jgi:hypothetical protein